MYNEIRLHREIYSLKIKNSGKTLLNKRHSNLPQFRHHTRIAAMIL